MGHTVGYQKMLGIHAFGWLRNMNNKVENTFSSECEAISRKLNEYLPHHGEPNKDNR